MPAVAAPVNRVADPEFPVLAVPVMNASAPDTPASPLFALRTITRPLDDAVPSPDDT